MNRRGQLGAAVLLASTLLTAARPAAAATTCHLYLADQSAATLGFALSVKSSVAGCPLQSANLVFLVGSSSVAVGVNWQTGVVYTVQAVLTSNGPQNLYLNGSFVGSVSGHFTPAPGPIVGSETVVDQPSASYVVRQLSLQVANGATVVSISPNNGAPVPLALIALEGGPAPWPIPFQIDPSTPTTVTVTFQIDNAPDSSQFKPYFDRFGQATAAAWPGKILETTADSQLQTAAANEQTWLATHPAPAGFDPYGGSLTAGWTASATGYFHSALRNGRWWLISPLGNPLFYIGVTGVFPWDTPITNREDLFSGLPSQTGPYSSAYSFSSTQAVTYYSPVVANEILKYCGGTACNFQHVAETLERQRLSSWGFAGVGKFAHMPANLPVVPVLEHDPAKVPAPLAGVENVVLNGHPDIFNPLRIGDLQTTLATQIGADATNPLVVGWSVGNEKDEIITASEVLAMLQLGPTTPAKRALVDYAFFVLYHGNLSTLNGDWGTTAATLRDLYSAMPKSLPSLVQEDLREFYEGAYYFTLSVIVKSIAPHHIYFGSWILMGDSNLSVDWKIAATFCDVIGFDDVGPVTLDPALLALIRSTNKPVLLGAWGAPSDYGGTRGYGWDQYTQALTLSDAASGDAYVQRMKSAVADPHVVGAMWFDYHDQPISGRGGTGAGDLLGGLVIGEHFAFGLLDVTDTPKYDLVEKVRAANLDALKTLRLLP